jgi:ABC-type multidrug transport system ATPase subunit
VLADRVGIIDHGHIVAEGTPKALKAEIGLPSVHATPVEQDDRDRLVSALEPYGESLDGGTGDVVVRLREGLAGLPAVVRAVDDAGLTLAHLEIQAPSLDDVFLAKTGRSLEGAGDDEPEAAEPAA